MKHVLPLSVLDLSPVPAGTTPTGALHNTLELAQHTDQLGYDRYWLSEHHNTQMLASASPELLAGQIAARTSRIRVGTGGIMLPNHAPLRIAEAFRLLEALYPKRVDLGLGRAPGTDMLTAMALRGGRENLQGEDFPGQLRDLLALLDDERAPDHPLRRLSAIPQGVPAPPVWLLGSSTFSARLAAQLGLGFAFAHHINPVLAQEALGLYHQHFQPSRWRSTPQSMLAVSAICAPSQSEAETLASSSDLTLLRFSQLRGQPGPIPSVAEAQEYPYTAEERAFVRANRSRLLVGDPEQLKAQLDALAAQTGAQELMLTTLIHDQALRLRSYSLLAEVFDIANQGVLSR